jgi:hypothetical protein
MSMRATGILSVVLLAGAAALLCAQPSGREPDNRPPKASPPGEGEVRAAPAITDQQEAELMGVLSERRPEEANRLRRLKSENPREHRLALAAAWKAYQLWKDLPPEIQRLHEIQQRARLEAWRLSQAYLAAKDNNLKERIRARILAVLGEDFDAEQGIREYRLGQLEEQLKRLRAELKDRAGRRAQVLDQTLQDLLAGRGRPRPEADVRRALEGARGRPAQAASRPAE